MWSRNGSPVETVIRPRPPSVTLAESWVSLVFRVTAAFLLLKPHLDRVGVRAQALQLREPHACFAERFQIAPVQAEDARALEKGVDSKRRGKPRGARRRQRVIGAGRVIAEWNGGVCADENRARVAHLRGQPFGGGGHDQPMPGRETVD